MVEGVDILDGDADQLRWEVGLDPHRQPIPGLQQRVRLRAVIFILVLRHHLRDVSGSGCYQLPHTDQLPLFTCAMTVGPIPATNYVAPIHQMREVRGTRSVTNYCIFLAVTLHLHSYMYGCVMCARGNRSISGYMEM